MVFAVELKWVVERLQQGACLVFTQFVARLDALASSLEARPVSAMSILYQQWRMRVSPDSIVSALRPKMNSLQLMPNGSAFVPCK